MVGQFDPMCCKAAMSGEFKRPPKTHTQLCDMPFVPGRLSLERSVPDMLHPKAGGHVQFTSQLETLCQSRLTDICLCKTMDSKVCHLGASVFLGYHNCSLKTCLVAGNKGSGVLGVIGKRNGERDSDSV